MAKRPDKPNAEWAGGSAGSKGLGGGRTHSAPYAYRPYSPEELEADPELWWKERQRQLRASASWRPIVKTKRREEEESRRTHGGVLFGDRTGHREKTLGELPAAGSYIRPESGGDGHGFSATNADRGTTPAGGSIAGTAHDSYGAGMSGGGVIGTGGGGHLNSASGINTASGVGTTPGSGYGGGAPTAPWYGQPAGPGDGLRPPGGYGERGGSFARFRRGLLMRTAVALLLYGLAWGWIKAELPGSGEAEAWMTLAVTQDMDFSAAEAWYGRMFGDSPSFLPVFRHGMTDAEEVTAEWDGQQTLPPVQGSIVESFKQNGTGVRIQAASGNAVGAVHSGRVIQVTKSSRGDATILVQHAGKIVTVYGGVEAAAVQPDDWVEAGGKLGVVGQTASEGSAEGSLYFAIRLGDKSLDPQEVIPFD